MVLLMAISIAHITVGAMYTHECPQQHRISVYLVVCGVWCTVLLLVLFYCMTYLNEIPCSFWSGAVAAFTFCWFISGSFWTFSIYPPNYNSTLPGELYCNKTLYRFAFVTIILTCITLVILLVVGCCVLICKYRTQ
ncbi:transmembrane protein 272-like [Astyanax mexicanus]|uniref:transmembrane protein 272-like n=1 Tax=Astyanax mexicanus TaxID=7994 RepID=UPI0020CB46F0|nr:transmembrane protein 272-like [Astyanax mexicanus]